MNAELCTEMARHSEQDYDNHGVHTVALEVCVLTNKKDDLEDRRFIARLPAGWTRAARLDPDEIAMILPTPSPPDRP